MKKTIFLTILLISHSLLAQTNFSAVLMKDTNVLSISLVDVGNAPPFEAGKLWKIMLGEDQKKSLDQQGFSMECTGTKINRDDVRGVCEINIKMENVEEVGDMQIFEVRGSPATQLNQYFKDNVSVTLQTGKVFITSFSSRREFYFGIQDALIER